MAIDRAAVDHVARLARLHLSPQERDNMRAQLADILKHVERIQALDLDGIEPTSHALSVRNVTRPDEVRPSLPQEVAIAGAPASEEGRFRVPRIIEEP
jgi:aspartyl-tRNA(Asn)/glutamyl-tRNA(Gln) amidotransferase subunit C